jgi:hypothetical protein
MMLAITLLAFAAAAPRAQELNPCDNVIQNVWDPRFTPGQRWSYHARPVDEGSTLIITKIDQVPGIGLVVQVDVDKVDYWNTPTHRYMPFNITEHIAIRRDSLDASVLQMVGIVLDPYDSGYYAAWQNDCVGRTVSTSVTDTITALQAQFCAQHVKNTSIPACKQPPKPPAKPSTTVSTIPTSQSSAPPTPSPTPSPTQ